MIRGMSFQKGIFFIGKNYLSCAWNDRGTIKEWVKPLNGKNLLLVGQLVIFSMPLSFKIFTVSFLLCVFVPILASFFGYYVWTGLPLYVVIYYLYGIHFIFPKQLRKYHGAEHKVFSYEGKKLLSNLTEIAEAKITNKYCSTNLVVIYFSYVILLTLILQMIYSFESAIAIASYSAFLVTPLTNSQLHRKSLNVINIYVLNVSYFLQKHITTTEPEELHLKTALRAYQGLAEKEFPSEIMEKSNLKKELKNMAIVDVTIIPIGTNSPSVSEYVVEIHKVLANYQDQVQYQLTPMSTIIEGEISILFKIIQELHEVLFSKGIERVNTNIRIDDRRDKKLTMLGKVASVESKLKSSDNE